MHAEAAAAAGFDVTAADIRAVLEELDAERKTKTQKAAQDLQALEDDDVENVAGGKIYRWDYVKGVLSKVPGCVHDFRDADCSLQDACHVAFSRYYDCEGTYYADKCKGDDYIENGTRKGW